MFFLIPKSPSAWQIVWGNHVRQAPLYLLDLLDLSCGSRAHFLEVWLPMSQGTWRELMQLSGVALPPPLQPAAALTPAKVPVRYGHQSCCILPTGLGSFPTTSPLDTRVPQKELQQAPHLSEIIRFWEGAQASLTRMLP